MNEFLVNKSLLCRLRLCLSLPLITLVTNSNQILPLIKSDLDTNICQINPLNLLIIVIFYEIYNAFQVFIFKSRGQRLYYCI